MSDSDFNAALASLQASGAAQRDPIGFQHMVLMAQRLQAQPGAVQRILAGRLREALARSEARASEAAAAPASSPSPSPSPSPATSGPLAELHRHIQAVSQAPATHAAASVRPAHGGTARPELKSLDRFRGTWAKVAADAQVDKALARAPENAGPLNSHLLVLRSLAALRELSPEHLHGVLAQLDALLWLEQATQKPTASPARRTGTKK